MRRQVGTTGSLVAGAVRGDPGAVRAFWSAHRGWVAAILLAHKPREADLDDLLQEVAVTVVRNIGDLRDQGAVKPWLRTVAINTARLAGRRQNRRRRVLGEVAQRARAGGRDGAASGERIEEGGRLLRLAEELPEGYREPLLLRCVQGMSYRTIGEVMGLPETTIETRIARGRRMLRELAQERGVDVAVGGGSGGSA